MGTSGTALFADDVACDVRDGFIAGLAAGGDPVDVTSALIVRHRDAIDDPDDGPVFWLALAAVQSKYGCLDAAVRARALAVIDGGIDAARWTGAAARRRQGVLDALRMQMLAPQPPLRRPRRRAQPVIPSLQVASADGTARAVVYELGKPGQADGLCMQVYLEMLAGGSWGGGHVVVGDCAYDDVSLTWLAADVLQIGYPAPALLHDARPTFYLCGRTIRIVYQPCTQPAAGAA